MEKRPTTNSRLPRTSKLKWSRVLAVGRLGNWRLAVLGVDLGSLSQLEPHEARDRDVLAEFGDGRLHKLADCDLRIADRRLIEEADLLVEAIQLALDDLVDDRC